MVFFGGGFIECCGQVKSFGSLVVELMNFESLCACKL